MVERMHVIKLFGLDIDDVFMADAAAELISGAERKDKCTVFFVNAHCVNVARRDLGYRDALSCATHLYADGVGMRVAARAAGRTLLDNVNGTDLFPVLLAKCSEKMLSVGFLGAAPGVAEECARKMEALYPGLQVKWVCDGFFEKSDSSNIAASISESKVDFLFVAMGVPLQEIWIAKNRDLVDVPVVLGVGALFDFYSSRIPRAPALIRRLSLEWVFRLAVEPKRMFRRYVLGNPSFLLFVLLRRLRGSKFLRERKIFDI